MALQPNHYGKTYLLELWIELEPDQRANLKKKLDEWIQQGIIELANSAWASPLVPVKKKDGRTRWVTELKHQGCLPPDQYPGKFAKVEGCKNLHFNQRLWSLPLDPDRRGEQGLYSFHQFF